MKSKIVKWYVYYNEAKKKKKGLVNIEIELQRWKYCISESSYAL